MFIPIKTLPVASGILAMSLSPTLFADDQCFAEADALQNAIHAQFTSDNPALEQAQALVQVLREDCEAGTTLDNAMPVASRARELLGLGESQ